MLSQEELKTKIIFTDGDAYMPDMPLYAIWIVFGGIQINPKGGKVIQIDDEQLDRLSLINRIVHIKEEVDKS